MKSFCIYLTTYHGNALPKYYIGSSSVERIQSGYRGSVLSNKWKTIWQNELSNNPHLFTTEILHTFSTREEALEAERIYQIENNVLLDSNWINESIAQPNGFFGRDVSGENNPMFGQGDKIKKAYADGKYKNMPEKCSESAISQWSNEEQRQKKILAMKGKKKSRKKLTEEQFREMQRIKALKAKEKISVKIEYENKIYNGWKEFVEITGITRYRFIKDNMGKVIKP